MANPVNTRDQEMDKFLGPLIRSESKEPAPEDLLKSTMAAIESLPAHQPVKGYSPPAWLKWGIPAVLAGSLLTLTVAGLIREPIQWSKTKSPDGNRFLIEISDWIGSFEGTLQLPAMDVPDFMIWAVPSGIILFWGFAILNRFLDRRQE